MRLDKKLVLENGMVFEGFGFGSQTQKFGEVVFTTGMTGYQESLTDPSFTQQLLIFTYPIIGNYGVNASDFESLQYGASGIIVSEFCEQPSHWKKTNTLAEYLQEKNISGISGIDTRALTKVIREVGTLRGCICSMNENTETLIQQLKDLTITGHVQTVSPKKPYTIPGKSQRIVVIDYGIKKSILQGLADRNCDLIVVPFDTDFDTIMRFQPDGILLSNGPGNPEELTNSIQTIKQLNGKIPIMGICLGHQLYALANGAKTERLLFGHRGANHPVYDIARDKVYITSQNHSYTVNVESLKKTDLIVTHVALNDKTIEGLRHQTFPAFTVQYHPEANPGPKDTAFLFDEFLTMIDMFEKEGVQ